MSDTPPSPWGQAFSQLTGHKAEAKRQPFQPHPPGIFWTGSAAQSVIEFLEANPGRFYTLGQLIAATGRTDKSLDWACRFLVSIDRLEWRSDESRNPRYRRYAFKPQPVDEGDQP